MLLAIGTKVRLKNTGDEGVIQEVLGDDLFTVYLADMDMEIPAFESNLERLDQHEAKAKVVKIKQPPLPEPPREAIQYKILTRKGVLLAFHPIYNQENSAEAFDIYLINDTIHDIIYNFEAAFEQSARLRKSAQIGSSDLHSIGRISFAQLNDRPYIRVDCWKITTKGTEGIYEQHFRIKPKNFFTRMLTVPLLNRPAYCYTLFDTLKTPPKHISTAQEDLASYTQRNARKRKANLDSQLYNLHDVQSFAEFATEIDLHIENLVSSTRKLTPTEMLNIQLSHYEEFLDKAIRLGIDRCFVIHGIGKGTLRDAIHNRLRSNQQIVDFKNEYHHRYGWGATEIILR
ncbi:MAG: DUF2027 domain-containing protein [Bacteroidota bacterium]